MGTQDVGSTAEGKGWALGGPTAATETLGTPQPCGAQPSHRNCPVLEGRVGCRLAGHGVGLFGV